MSTQESDIRSKIQSALLNRSQVESDVSVDSTSDGNTTLPTYYSKLNDYFPGNEMKHPEHLASLLDKEMYYHKQETDEYLILYAEFPDFLFVDYLLVSSTQRGSGVGSRVMRSLKQKQKPIILEVEPVDPTNPDTKNRRRFYGRHGFRHYDAIHYRRFNDDGTPFDMDLLVWEADQSLVPQTVYHMMKRVCHRIHNHNADEYYDELPADPKRVLSLTGAHA